MILGKRSFYMTVALVAMLLIGRAVTPTLRRIVLLNPSLKEAIEDLDLDRAIRVIDQGADVNLSVPISNASRPDSPLALAASKGNLAVTRRFLSLGADVDRQNYFANVGGIWQSSRICNVVAS